MPSNFSNIFMYSYVDSVWTWSQWWLKTGGKFCSIYLLSFFFLLFFLSLFILFVYFLPSIVICSFFFYLLSCHSEHIIYLMCHQLSWNFTYTSVFTLHISCRQQICIFIKVSFAVGIMGTFSPIKAWSYSWVHQFSVHIWNSHKHFCKSTIYWLQTITAHRGTVVQLDQVWCSLFFLVAFVHLDAFINTLLSIGPKLVKNDYRV
jgi:hypothetical protein